MSAQRPLALSFPLFGSRLIEASAGTGKTFTISALYLRLILGHGGDVGFKQPLLPPQILVVTFTDAATRELRDRIRARLVQAAKVFREEHAGDDLLQLLRSDFEASQWPACAQRLELAAQWMDEAAVSTIHGWCQRMLREHAFDSGSLFNQTLETDHSELLAEVVRDYWRQHCYPLTGDALAWVAAQWGAPQALGSRIRALLNEELQQGDMPLDALISHALNSRKASLLELKAPWPQWADELESLLDKAVADKQVDARKIQARFYKPWFEKIREWAHGEAGQLDIGTGFTRLTPHGLAEAWKGTAPEHPALEAMSRLSVQLAALPDPAEAALCHAAAWVRHRFDQEKRQRAQMGFDDMLIRLDQALRSDAGPRLAEVIRAQFPLALIDEFQDTDPLQYRIFDTIYEVEANRADCGLFMIGDPKQAIYSFRGADIYTYLSARRATLGRHYNLDTNYRSSHDMVAAVNQLFLTAEERASGQGAFLFRTEQGSDLPFLEVKAQGRKALWSVAGEAQNALNLWHYSEPQDPQASAQPLSKSRYIERLAGSAASEITRLLNLGQQGLAGFAHGTDLQALKPNDIAVLVRDFNEAQAIRQQLAERGVRSVYLSDKDSVFASLEARDLLLWLRACAEPDQDRPLRAALASATLALDLAQLEQLNLDERSWERRVMQFRDYRKLWQRLGVLPMLRKLLQDFTLAQRLMRRENGERALTNLLHLAELLQQAASELDGEHALIRHLSELIAGHSAGADEQVLRLESDEALVRVVTIHKSKGLEYPLVFLPFICAMRPVDGSKPTYVHDGERRQLHLSLDEQRLARAEIERLGEDLRLLYVALTRAQYACWLGIADLKVGNTKSSRLHDSAIGYLLGGGQALTDTAQLAAWLEPFNQPKTSAVLPAPEATTEVFKAVQHEAPSIGWRKPVRKAAEHWWIASYSALRVAAVEADEPKGQRHDDAAPDSAALQVAGDDEQPLAMQQLSQQQAQQQARLVISSEGLHRFPRGPNPGTFLHGLLEFAASEGFSRVAGAPQLLREMIAQRCQRRGLETWIEPLSQWLQELLAQPIALGDERAVSLGQLTEYQAEMEFWFAVSHVDVRKLDQLVRDYERPQLERVPLEADHLNGMFKGFIDLVFEHQGRYYLLDYKSNWLGVDNHDYTLESMERAVASHRYDLQYVLYVLALHRQLRLRLGDAYHYDEHLGGAVYLFMRAPAQGVYFAKPARALIEQLDALFSGAAKEAASWA